MAAPSAWTFFNTFREAMADGTVDLDSDTFVCGLSTSSWTIDVENDAAETDIENELSGNGYARDTLACTWTRSTNTVTFDSDDATFTASGGPITARYAWILDTTADILVAYSVLDSDPADVTVTDTNTLTVGMNASGIFTLADAA